MKIRSGKATASDLFPTQLKSNLKIDDRTAEIKRVLNRIQTLFEPHFENAEKMGMDLTFDDVISVLDALIAEADGLAPEPHLKCPDEVRQYLRQSIFDELVGEPSNILYSTKVSSDVMRYEAMPADFWKQCLCDLKEQLLSS